jgi:hypothetical protein
VKVRLALGLRRLLVQSLAAGTAAQAAGDRSDLGSDISSERAADLVTTTGLGVTDLAQDPGRFSGALRGFIWSIDKELDSVPRLA